MVELVEIFLKLSMKTVQVHLIIWTTLVHVNKDPLTHHSQALVAQLAAQQACDSKTAGSNPTASHRIFQNSVGHCRLLSK